jgi:hypothetical protein
MPNLVPESMNEWMRRTESRESGLMSQKSNLVARAIGDTVDLDDFLWSGRYYRESPTGTTTALGYPVDGSAGTLEVIRNPASIEAQQVFHDRVNGISWIRWYDGVSWGPWMSGGSQTAGFWTDYTPSLTNLALGNGTMTARFTSIGDTVYFWVSILFGSTTSVSGAIGVGAPLAGFSTTGFVYPMGTAIAKDSLASGQNVFKGFTTNAGNGPVTEARIVSAGSASGGAWNATNPLTWATGDILSVKAMYEAA